MSANTHSPLDAADGPDRDTLPTFELSCLFDDADDAGRVTVFDGREETIVSHWITVDADAAVSLESVR